MSDIEHFNPYFCPQTLVEYRSMDAPDVLGYLEALRRRQFEGFNIEQIETSKRLDQKTLERCWGRNSQDSPLELPDFATNYPIF